MCQTLSKDCFASFIWMVCVPGPGLTYFLSKRKCCHARFFFSVGMLARSQIMKKITYNLTLLLLLSYIHNMSRKLFINLRLPSRVIVDLTWYHFDIHWGEVYSLQQDKCPLELHGLYQPEKNYLKKKKKIAQTDAEIWNCNCS